MLNEGGSRCLIRVNQITFNCLINKNFSIGSLRNFIKLSLLTFMSKYNSATNALNNIYDAKLRYSSFLSVSPQSSSRSTSSLAGRLSLLSM